MSSKVRVVIIFTLALLWIRTAQATIQYGTGVQTVNGVFENSFRVPIRAHHRQKRTYSSCFEHPWRSFLCWIEHHFSWPNDIISKMSDDNKSSVKNRFANV
jgi:hypothetical protein